MNQPVARPDATGSPHPFIAAAPQAQAARDAGVPVRFHLVDLTGCPGDFIARMLPTAQKVLAEMALTPVFVTDGLDLMVFRRQHVLFEVLPHPDLLALARPDLDWAAYRTTRLARIRLKWRPAGETRLTGEAEAFSPDRR